MKFIKIVAAGNDFIFLSTKDFSEKIIKKICDRNSGVGADGVVFIDKDMMPLKWDFYNCDGSKAELCGNAARAMAVWGDYTLQQKKISFQTARGVVISELIGFQMAQATLPLKVSESRSLSIEIEDEPIHFELVDAGVPHAVMRVNSLEESQTQTELIKAIRHSPLFAPHGTNVTLLEQKKDLNRSITFERGVENFTQSCGTGVIAAASVARKSNPAEEIEILTPGGKFKVSWSADGVVLVGNVKLVCDGEFYESEI